MKYKTVDSGKRQKFKTGAVRDFDENKGRFDLIPPIAVERLALLYERGAKKYGESNWTLGMPMHRLLDSALRHLNKYRIGLRDEDHLTAGVWNLFAAIHAEEMVLNGLWPKDLYDIPKYINPKKMDKDTKKWWDGFNELPNH